MEGNGLYRLPHRRSRLNRMRLRALFVCTFIAASFLFFSPIESPAQTSSPTDKNTPFIQDDDCLACHDQIDPTKFNASIHGRNRCTSCHSDIKEIPHPEKVAKVQCSECHQIESEIYYASDHGVALKAGAPAAACLDCHGNAHELLDYRNHASPVNRMNIPKTCAVCHENEEKMARYALLESMPLKSYTASIHGKALLEEGILSSAVCTDCHGSHDLHAPTNPDSKIYKFKVPNTCGKCHENVLHTYQKSVHGKAAIAGKLESPVCTDCHGEHTIKAHTDPTSSVYPTQISEKTCGHCHGAEKITTKYRLPPDAVKTFLESYHGLASKFGDITVANCASCHGAHDILPSNDPHSSVHKSNLAKTCGRCHPGVSAKLMEGNVHVKPTSQENRIVYYVTIFYISLIVAVIGGMIVHNILDFRRKLKEHYELKKKSGTYIRFNAQERIQHAFLTYTFLILAYSGFALNYPDAWWALLFKMIPGGGDLRGIIHRAAAIIFIATSVHHILYMSFKERGRVILGELIPGKHDFSDFIQKLKYNLGLSKIAPLPRKYNYEEKAEYWALIWGSLIMVLTGGMLTFENFIMKHLPKWTIDVALAVHFYEAVLAFLAVLVWHFYFVIFDPHHYPLNWSMHTGTVSEKEKEVK